MLLRDMAESDKSAADAPELNDETEEEVSSVLRAEERKGVLSVVLVDPLMRGLVTGAAVTGVEVSSELPASVDLRIP